MTPLPSRALPESVQCLMEHAIDYAGLFPPAGLDMATAAANYASYAGSGDSWMLGQFILPMQRGAEFLESGSARTRNPSSSPEWPLSILCGLPTEKGAEALARLGPPAASTGCRVASYEATAK